MIRDEELCRQVQEGSEAAMEALVHRYHRPVFAYLYRLTYHRQTAEDLTQESFARLLARIGTYRFPQPFRPWLFTIAHNLYKDHCKAAEQRAIPAAEPVSAHVPALVDLSERIAEQAAVSGALRSLEPDQREVVLLRFYQDLKVDDIARVTGVPAGTVKSRLFHAVRKLKALLLDRPDAQEGRDRREA